MWVIVVAGASTALIQVLQHKKESTETNAKRQDLTRALEFIAFETQHAEEIIDPGTIITFSPESGISNDENIIGLKIPNPADADNPHEVVYYIAQPPSGSVWSGERVIYRWGPELNLDGSYSSSSSNEVLIDNISDQTPSNNPNCPSGWVDYPAKADREGFYACIKDNDKAIASVYIEGEKAAADDKVSVETKIFAR